MPQDELRIAGRDSQVLEQSCGGMPQMMQADHPQPVSVTDAAEGPDQVPRLDRAARPGGEHQAVVLPSAAELGAVGRLRVTADRQHIASQLATAASARESSPRPPHRLSAATISARRASCKSEPSSRRSSMKPGKITHKGTSHHA